MAATKASIGYLAEFYLGTNASPPVFTALAEVKSIKAADMTVPSLDATHLQSPNATEEKLPGIIKPGTYDITGNLTSDASQLNIPTLMTARTVIPFKMTAPTNSNSETLTVLGNCFISKFELGTFEVSKVDEFSMTIEITGQPTYTAM